MPTKLEKINLPDEVPGFISHLELIHLSYIATLIPENKKILEIGSLFGRSTNAFLENSHDSVTTTAIDPFMPLDENADEWSKRNSKIMFGSNKLKSYAFELTKNTNSFRHGFEYFTKKYSNTDRLVLLNEKSEDVSFYKNDTFHKNLEVLFIDGDHHAMKNDFIKFQHLIDGLILIHDFFQGGDYGNEIIQDCIECSQIFQIPFTILPRTSIAVFCKSSYWEDKLFQICKEAELIKREWSNHV